MQTSFDTIKQVYLSQQSQIRERGESSYSERIERLDRIYQYLKDKSNESRLYDAIYNDFNKPEAEVVFTEYVQVLSHIKYIKKHLKSWMRPQTIKSSLAMTGLRSYIQYQSKGHVLIIAPWNYPFFLSINPMLYAIAAGCRIILKPSEYTTHTSQYIEDMIHSLFDESEVFVVQGAVKETTYLLENKWNHIFFTGSPQVGKIVMKAASNYLASVTLELGGKSPCIVDESADLKAVVDRLIWGKMVNAGQTCVAPDYVLVPKSLKEKFFAECKRVITKRYGKEPSDSTSFAKIITEKHATRLKDLLDDARSKGAGIEHGGSVNVKERYIAPTILSNVREDMMIMQEEIFGPILPVVEYGSLDEAISLINGKLNPLSLYICSKEPKNIKKISQMTTSGGVVINDFLLGAAFPEVPFGGMNNSGIGKSYGKHGFIEFTNEKPIIKRNFLSLDMIYPPYDKRVGKILAWFKRIMG